MEYIYIYIYIYIYVNIHDNIHNDIYISIYYYIHGPAGRAAGRPTQLFVAAGGGGVGQQQNKWVGEQEVRPADPCPRQGVLIYNSIY